MNNTTREATVIKKEMMCEETRYVWDTPTNCIGEVSHPTVLALGGESLFSRHSSAAVETWWWLKCILHRQWVILHKWLLAVSN